MKNNYEIFKTSRPVHIRLPNPFNFFRGMSPLTVAYLAAQSDYAAAQFMKGKLQLQQGNQERDEL